MSYYKHSVVCALGAVMAWAFPAAALERSALGPNDSGDDLSKSLLSSTNTALINALGDEFKELKDLFEKFKNCSNQGKFYSTDQDKCIDIVEKDPTVGPHAKKMPPQCTVVDDKSKEAHVWRSDKSVWECTMPMPKDCSASIQHGKTWAESCQSGYSGSINKLCYDGNVIQTSNNCTRVYRNCGSYAHGQTWSESCGSGYTGNITKQCDDGSVKTINNSCVVKAPTYGTTGTATCHKIQCGGTYGCGEYPSQKDPKTGQSCYTWRFTGTAQPNGCSSGHTMRGYTSGGTSYECWGPLN